MKRVFFLVNTLSEFDFGATVKEILGETRVTIGDSLPSDLADYSLIVLWSVRKLLPEVVGRDNVIVFHSSDLPLGKGWAPVYNAIAGGEAFFTVTGMLPVREADEGEIIVKARFPMRPEYTAETIRKWDHRICIILIGKLLTRFPDGHLKGMPQKGPGSWFPKRKPSDNEVDLARPLAELIAHLRACEPSHPAYFNYRGVKYFLKVTPEIPSEFPSDLDYEFYDTP